MTKRFVASLGLPIMLAAASLVPEYTAAQTQTANAPATAGLEGTWQGTLHVAKDLRFVLKISKDNGTWKAVLTNIDANTVQGYRATAFTPLGSAVKLEFGGMDSVFEGTLGADGATLAGTIKPGTQAALPLNLARATAATAWAIPEPPVKLKPMDPSLSPGVEVATIKQALDQPGRYFRVEQRRLSIANNDVKRMICWAYDIHPEQVIGAPEWTETERFDITAIPDGEGQPNYYQYKAMLQKLLADRFKLKFHHDSKVFSVFVVTVAKGGPKMTPTAIDDPNAQPGMFFSGNGVWPGSNISMKDFANMMQRNILDRPVVDRTGLKGRYDFLLKYTPDETQARATGLGAAPAERTDQPPDLFTAVQQELGMKLESTKAAVETYVIDHVERPSGN